MRHSLLQCRPRFLGVNLKLLCSVFSMGRILGLLGLWVLGCGGYLVWTILDARGALREASPATTIVLPPLPSGPEQKAAPDGCVWPEAAEVCAETHMSCGLLAVRGRCGKTKNFNCGLCYPDQKCIVWPKGQTCMLTF